MVAVCFGGFLGSEAAVSGDEHGTRPQVLLVCLPGLYLTAHRPVAVVRAAAAASAPRRALPVATTLH